MTAKLSFTEFSVRRAIKAAKKEGWNSVKIVQPNGTVIVVEKDENGIPTLAPKPHSDPYAQAAGAINVTTKRKRHVRAS